MLGVPTPRPRRRRRLAQRLRVATAQRARPTAHPRATSPCARRRCPPGRRFKLPVSTTGDNIGVRAFFRSPLGDYEPVVARPDARGEPRRPARPDPVPARDARPARSSTCRTAAALPRTAARASSRARGACSTLGAPTVDGKPVPHAFARLDRHGRRRAAAARELALRAHARPPATLPAARSRPTAPDPRARDAGGRRGGGPERRSSRCRSRASRSPARVVGVVHRFPSIVGDAVVADRQTMATLFDTRSPGLGTTDELWLDVPSRDEAATAARSSGRRSRAHRRVACRDARARCRADPLARGALLTLAGTAAVALAARARRAGARAWSPTCATSAASCSTSRRRAPRRRRSARTCGCARCSSRLRHRRRARARRDPLGARDLARLGDGDRRRARAAAAARARPGAARGGGRRLRRCSPRCSSPRRRACAAARPTRAAEAAA